jgi:hypothetical protein
VHVRLAWPLTGRLEELRIIEAAISDADLSGIVIFGAAGVGKSRIAQDALSLAASKGCEIRWAVGTSSASALPLGAFASWAESGVTENLQLVRGVIASLTHAPAGALWWLEWTTFICLMICPHLFCTKSFSDAQRR